MKKIITTLTAFILFPSYIVIAQQYTDGISDAPIDGGLSLLIASGSGYAIKQTVKRKNNKKA